MRPSVAEQEDMAVTRGFIGLGIVELIFMSSFNIPFVFAKKIFFRGVLYLLNASAQNYDIFFLPTR